MIAFIQKINAKYVILLCIGVFSQALAQNTSVNNKSQLEERRSKLNAEIELLNKQVQQIKKTKKHSLSELVALNLKIEKRNALLQTISQDISRLNADMDKNRAEEQRLTLHYKTIKALYIQSVLKAQKDNYKFHFFSFLLQAESFHQALYRYKYMQQLALIRHNQGEELKRTKSQLNKTIAVIHSQLDEKERLKISEEHEKSKLSSEKNDKQRAVTELQRKEKAVKKELEQKRKTALRLQSEIKRLIEREIAKRQKPLEKNESTATSKPKVKNTPQREIFDAQEIALSKEFITNKGILPWPVDRGVICESYGTHEHPAIKGFMMTNNGVELCVLEGTKARSIFSGEVTSIAASPSGGSLVIIRHGEYLSVYCNLDQITVSVGQMVKPKQVLGKILYNAHESRYAMNFQIWKSQKTINPEDWLQKNIK